MSSSMDRMGSGPAFWPSATTAGVSEAPNSGSGAVVVASTLAGFNVSPGPGKSEAVCSEAGVAGVSEAGRAKLAAVAGAAAATTGLTGLTALVAAAGSAGSGVGFTEGGGGLATGSKAGFAIEGLGGGGGGVFAIGGSGAVFCGSGCAGG